MRIAVFSTKSYTKRFFEDLAEESGHEPTYFEERLVEATASLASGFPCLCAFVNDRLGATVLETLAGGGTKLIALRCAGYNNVDLHKAADLGMTVVRVPAYSPHAVAEHAMGLILALNRKVHRAHQRIREGNFDIAGLLGFDIAGKTAGLVGTGKIGTVLAKILHGFGCRLLGYDPFPNDECRELGMEYLTLPEVLSSSDMISLHCPLTPDTRYMIDRTALRIMKPGAMLINTSRGLLVDTLAAIEALKMGHLGHLGIDVYEEEEDLFFENLSDQVIQDDMIARLLMFPNVIVTGHQAFFTEEALEAIARTTLENVTAFEKGETSGNEVRG